VPPRHSSVTIARDRHGHSPSWPRGKALLVVDAFYGSTYECARLDRSPG
jgi:hypothetical protein